MNSSILKVVQQFDTIIIFQEDVETSLKETKRRLADAQGELTRMDARLQQLQTNCADLNEGQSLGDGQRSGRL